MDTESKAILICGLIAALIMVIARFACEDEDEDK